MEEPAKVAKAPQNLSVRVKENEREAVDAVVKKLYRSGRYSDLLKDFIATLQSKPIREVRDFLAVGDLEEERDKKLPVTLFRFNSVAPCGDFVDVATEQNAYEVNGEMAELLGLIDGDWVVPVAGVSMVGADIPDGSTLVMRPFDDTTEPRNGDVCLAQIISNDGRALWTVKRWRWSGFSVKLVNGQREELSLPKHAVELRAIAYKVAALKFGRK